MTRVTIYGQSGDGPLTPLGSTVVGSSEQAAEAIPELLRQLADAIGEVYKEKGKR